MNYKLARHEQIYGYKDLEKLINAANYVEIRSAKIFKDTFRAVIITDSKFGKHQEQNEIGCTITIQDRDVVELITDDICATRIVAEIPVKTTSATEKVNDIMRIAMQKAY